MVRIAIGNDHAGLNMKSYIISFFKKNKYEYEFIDVGTNLSDIVDYTSYGFKVAKLVSSNYVDFGIVICGTGIGISIAANRIKGARAALCYEVTTAKLAREHNNANILALGARIIANENAIWIITAFLNQSFNKSKYLDRVEKLDDC